MFLSGTWPTARTETLKAMHAAGATASAIAAKLSADEGITVSRNAVVGKIDRLKLGRRVKPELTPEELQVKRERERERHNRNQNKRRNSTAYLSIRPRAEKIRMEDVPDMPPLNLTLHDLTMKDGRPVECRAITNEDMTNATYCGHPVDGETSWCLHHRLKYQPPKGWIGPACVPKIACAA